MLALLAIPGLALFYSGLVGNRNVLSVLMQCFAITCLVSIFWVVIGYSLVFPMAAMVVLTVIVLAMWTYATIRVITL